MSNIKLVSKASIAGVVTDEQTGYPLSNVDVQIAGSNWQTKTGNDGFYFFYNLPQGNYSIVAVARDEGSKYGQVTVSGVVVSSNINETPLFDAKANIALSPTRLQGTVKRSIDGVAITGALIRVVGSESQTISASNGNFSLTGLYEGKPNIRISATGFTTVVKTVDLHAGMTTNLIIALTP